MSNRKRIFATILVILAILVFVVELRSRNIGPSDRPEITTETQPFKGLIKSGVNRDGIPSLQNPDFDTVRVADSYLSDSGRGVVVSFEGESRFYANQIMVWHNVVNDTIGSSPILVTYCPLCGAGLVFERTINGTELEFGVSEFVWNSSIILYDKSSESLWSPVLAQVVSGAMTGKSLIQIEADVMTWEMFKSQFPRGSALSNKTGFPRDYTRNPYPGYEEDRKVFFPLDNRDDRLHPKELVYGYLGPDGEEKAFPLQYLIENGKIEDSVNGRRVLLTYSDGIVRAEGENHDGEIVEVLLQPMYWFTWIAVHPESELYDPIGDAKRAEEALEEENGE